MRLLAVILIALLVPSWQSGSEPASVPGQEVAPLTGQEVAPLPGQEVAPLRGQDVAPLRGTADDLPRVIIELDRYETVRGHVEFEDDELIFVRKLDGMFARYSKAELRQIIRLVDPKPGQTGVVRLKGGNMRRGIILADTFENVRIEMAGGVAITLPRDLVDRVELLPTVEEQYLEFKRGIRPDMIDAHLELCRWLIDKRQYALAERELEDLEERHNLPAVKKLLTTVRAHLVLERDRIEAESEGDADETHVAAIEGDILTEADVNLIRVFEIDFNNPPKLNIDRRTIRRLIDSYGTNSLLPREAQGRDRLFRAEPLEIVQLLFALRARELYPEIQVLSEPPALNMFRQRVHDAFLMNNCATSRCHGGPDAGRFILHRHRYKDARVRYTNLLILERLELDPQWPLINWESPGDSLLIQYGLPAAHARRPHPAVPGWRSAFRRPDDRMVRRTLEWMGAMLKPRMEYPIELDLPKPRKPAEDAGEPPR